MSIQTRRELEVTQAKLRRLEAKLAELQSQPAAHEQIQELNLQALHKWINRFKEEIARFEARTPAKA